MDTRQRGLNFVEACQGCLIGVVTSGAGIDHHREGAAQAVKDQHLLRKHQQNIGHTQFIGWAGVHQLGFGKAHRVVTKVAHEPAMKHRKLRRGSANKCCWQRSISRSGSATSRLSTHSPASNRLNRDPSTVNQIFAGKPMME